MVRATLIVISFMFAIIVSVTGCDNDNTIPPLGPSGSTDEIISGGVPRDGIPALTLPETSPVSGVPYMSDDDLIIGVSINGTYRAYPVDILNYHEIINDNLAGRSICVTYCPLTGSGVVFNSIINGLPLEFGVSGLLFRNNLIPYDRTTESLYSQMYAEGIRGDRNGLPLPLIPSVRTTWGHWKSNHPETDIVSRNTGYSRSYGSNPYGNYPNNYDILFPVRFPDNSYHPKHLTLGVAIDDNALAFPASELMSRKAANVIFEGVPIVVFYDPAAEMMAAYSPVVNRDTLRFSVIDGPGQPFFRDEQTNSIWSSEGLATDGPFEGTRLDQLPYYTAYWFAWHDFYPETEVYSAPG